MNKIAILLDSTCDLTPELLEKYDLDYCEMGVSIDDKEYPASLYWDSGITPKEFYDYMRKNKNKRILTIQVREKTYETKFNKYLDKGCDIIYISCSSALSGSINTGRSVAKRLMEEKKGSRIICIDSLTSGMAQGFLGIWARELSNEGKTLDEIVKVIEDNKLNMNQWATVGSLSYLAKAGRVKASAAFFGNLLGVKPIIISDAKGNNFAYKKVKGRETSLIEIADSVKNSIVEPEKHCVAVCHADCLEEASKLKKLIEERVKCKGVLLMPLGPILGCSCGPDTVSAFHFGKKVTLVGN